jgi:hypothetical protein
MGDLYNLPRGLLTQIKDYVAQDFPLRIDSAPQVSLFAYDNGTFVIQSFRADDAAIRVHLADETKIVRDAVSGKVLDRVVPQGAAQSRGRPQGTAVAVTIPPHSYRVFRIDEAH